MALAIAILALGATVPFALGDSPCPIDAEPWSAGVDEYDFLQSISFATDGGGDYMYGYAQAVRFEARFRYRVLDGETLELRDFVELDADGREHPLGWPPQHIGYELDRGRYCFQPPYAEERCYACRLTLGSVPMPGSYHDYYACRVNP